MLPKPYLNQQYGRRLPERKFMTVCVAALAARARAVICIADKSIAYGDRIQWDSDASKLFRLQPSGAIVMFSGGERDITEVIARIITVQDQLGTDKQKTRDALQKECKGAIDFLIDRLYLAPNQLTRDQYITAISGPEINPFIKSIAEKVSKFELDCHLLLCGSEKGKPFILSVDENGLVTDLTNAGSGAIGTGSEYATARLLFSDHERNHDIERVLFDVFDAKATAELALYVGYAWDAWIFFPGKLGVHEVPKEKKKILEDAWSEHNRSPFEEYDSKEHSDPPPPDWKDQLKTYAESLIVKEVRKNKRRR